MSLADADAPFQVVIWEWKNDFDAWEPYEPVVVKAIEDRREGHKSVSLTTLFPSLFPAHQIVFHAQTPHAPQPTAGYQVNTKTAKQRPIRRKVVSSTDTGGVAKGIFWKWKGDNRHRLWNFYPVEISQRIEEHREKFYRFGVGAAINLEPLFPAFPYTVDVSRSEQKKNTTGFVRELKREITIHFPRVGGSSTAGIVPASSLSADGKDGVRSSVLVGPESRKVTKPEIPVKSFTSTAIAGSVATSSNAATSSTHSPAPLAKPRIAAATPFSAAKQNPLGISNSVKQSESISLRTDPTNDSSAFHFWRHPAHPCGEATPPGPAKRKQQTVEAEPSGKRPLATGKKLSNLEDPVPSPPPRPPRRHEVTVPGKARKDEANVELPRKNAYNPNEEVTDCASYFRMVHNFG